MVNLNEMVKVLAVGTKAGKAGWAKFVLAFHGLDGSLHSQVSVSAIRQRDDDGDYLTVLGINSTDFPPGVDRDGFWDVLMEIFERDTPPL